MPLMTFESAAGLFVVLGSARLTQGPLTLAPLVVVIPLVTCPSAGRVRTVGAKYLRWVPVVVTLPLLNLQMEKRHVLKRPLRPVLTSLGISPPQLVQSELVGVLRGSLWNPWLKLVTCLLNLCPSLPSGALDIVQICSLLAGIACTLFGLRKTMVALMGTCLRLVSRVTLGLVI